MFGCMHWRECGRPRILDELFTSLCKLAIMCFVLGSVEMHDALLRYNVYFIY